MDQAVENRKVKHQGGHIGRIVEGIVQVIEEGYYQVAQVAVIQVTVQVNGINHGRRDVYILQDGVVDLVPHLVGVQVNLVQVNPVQVMEQSKVVIKKRMEDIVIGILINAESLVFLF